MSGAAGARLRPMRWEDIAALAALDRDLFGPQAWSQASWWSELAARPRRAYACLQDGDGEVLGYAGLDLGRDAADVMTVAVARSARGRGLGHVLLRWLVGQAAARGAADLVLEVRDDNTAARALYERWGFHVVNRRRGYYRGVDALVMRRRLTDADRAGDTPGARPERDTRTGPQGGPPAAGDAAREPNR